MLKSDEITFLKPLYSFLSFFLQILHLYYLLEINIIEAISTIVFYLRFSYLQRIGMPKFVHEKLLRRSPLFFVVQVTSLPVFQES
jgi:hypothetical protein